MSNDLYVKGSNGRYKKADPDTVMEVANAFAKVRLEPGATLSSPMAAKECLRRLYSEHEREVFLVLLLDSQHRLLKLEELSHGTINAASVYPREVVKAALRVNAAAVILCHNHPSGKADPSSADEAITKRIQKAMALIEVRVLDHLVVGFEGTYSFAEHGRIV